MTDLMPLADAVRWIGPDEVGNIMRHPDPYQYATDKCDHHHERGDHHLPAWVAIQNNLCGNREASTRLFIELKMCPNDWRDVIDTDPIPPWALRAARDEHGLTQAQMAEALRTRYQTVQNWELGLRKLSGPSAAAVELFFKNIA